MKGNNRIIRRFLTYVTMKKKSNLGKVIDYCKITAGHNS